MALKTLFPLVIDSTMLMEADDCPMAFFRKYLQHLSSGYESTDLIAGKAFARGLEVTRKAYFNDDADPEFAIAAGVEALIESYGDHESFSAKKTAEKMCSALELYFMHYPLGIDDVVPAKLSNGEYAIEYSFAHELPFEHPDIPGLPIIITGRADMLAEYAGRLWVVDEKTTGSAFTKDWPKQWDTRGQFSTYPWGLKKDGIPVAGAIVRGISLGAKTITFQQCESIRGEWQLDIWEFQMLKKVEALLQKYIEWKASGKHPSYYFFGNWASSCMKYFKPCQFQDLCRSRTSEQFLESQYDQYIWLPHKQERMELNTYLDSIGYSK
jgi:hypothetical protein